MTPIFRNRVVVWSFFLLVGLVGLAAQAAPLPTLRAAYLGIESFEQRPDTLARLHRHGFTTALVSDGSFRWQMARWRIVAAAAERHGLALVAVAHLAVPQEWREQPGPYRAYVNREGLAYAKTPCPADETYWQRVIEDQFVRLAEESAQTVAGVVFDAELYGSDINWYNDLCYCDVCWQRFAASKGADFFDDMAAVAAPARFRWLLEHDLLRQYTEFQWRQVRDILSGIARRLHRLRPAWHLGFLCYRHNWFFTALVHGLGTPERPALVFSESSYVRGYTPNVDVERDQARRTAGIARYVPGIWLERFAPPTLAPQLVDAALNTDGYWLYATAQFWRDDQEDGPWTRHGSKEAYWTALERANSELRSVTDSAPGGRRTLAAVHPSSFYDAAAGRLLTTDALRRSAQSALDVPAPVGDPPVYRGQALFHCRIPEAGTVTMTHIPLGKNTDPDLVKQQPNVEEPLQYQVFNADGILSQAGRVAPEESPKAIALPGDPQGLTALLVASDTNGFQLVFSGMACLAEASSTYPLGTFRSAAAYQLYVPADVERLNLRVAAPRQESALVTLHPPAPFSARQVQAQWFSELHAINPRFHVFAGQSSRWRIQVDPAPDRPFGDARVYLYDAAFPYVRVPESRESK